MNLSLPSEIINKLINFGGVKKSLMCKTCGNFTEHVSVSWAVEESGTFGEILGRVYDIIPTQNLLFGNPFVCIKCGEFKHDGGVLSDWYNKRPGSLRGLILKGNSGWKSRLKIK